VPTTVHQLRQFIGLTSYFRRFISNYAVKSKPLAELLKQDVPWLWGEKQIEAFKTIKDYLVSKPIFALYDQNLEMRLYTDASAIGIASILVKSGTTGKMLYHILADTRPLTNISTIRSSWKR
jgi:hypothetical protein